MMEMNSKIKPKARAQRFVFPPKGFPQVVSTWSLMSRCEVEHKSGSRGTRGTDRESLHPGLSLRLSSASCVRKLNEEPNGSSAANHSVHHRGTPTPSTSRRSMPRISDLPCCRGESTQTEPGLTETELRPLQSMSVRVFSSRLSQRPADGGVHFLLV